MGKGHSEARTRQRMQMEDGDRQEGPSSRCKKSQRSSMGWRGTGAVGPRKKCRRVTDPAILLFFLKKKSLKENILVYFEWFTK